jgi:hypothetical protein
MRLHRSGVLRADARSLIVRRQLSGRNGLCLRRVHAYRDRNACELLSGKPRWTHRAAYCVAQRMNGLL